MGPRATIRRRHRAGRAPACRDDGFAILTVVIVAALLLALSALLLAAILPGNQSSARQRELYAARATGAGAIEYLYALLDHDPDFFAGMLAEISPSTYSWIDLSSAAAPDVTADGDWNQFGDDLAISSCTTRADPCWVLRFKGGGSQDPEEAAVEAIVRFDCRSGGFCSTRRFQQQLRRLVADPPHDHEWTRSGLTEVTAAEAVSGPAVTTTTAPLPPDKPLNARFATPAVGTLEIAWDAPSGGTAPTGYVAQVAETDPAGDDSVFGSDATADGTATSHQFADTYDPQSTYWLRVRLTNDNGAGPWSDVVSGVPYGSQPPPRNLRATSMTANSVSVAWDAPEGGLEGNEEYLLQYRSGGEQYEQFSRSFRINRRTTSQTISGLNAGTTYMIQVLAGVSPDYSVPAAEVTVTTDTG